MSISDLKKPTSDLDSISATRVLMATKMALQFKGKLCSVIYLSDYTEQRKTSLLENQNRLLNLLTVSVTHELSTPLNCMIQIVNNVI